MDVGKGTLVKKGQEAVL